MSRMIRLFSSASKPNNLKVILGAGALAGIAGVCYLNMIHKPIMDNKLDENEFKPFKLVSVDMLNHNTGVFRFQIPKDQSASTPTASFVITRFGDGQNDPISRPYTPISKESDKGFFDLLIKKYPDGKMSSHIHSLKPGDLLEVKGPIPKFKVEANMADTIGMIAGGTGITPMYQIIQKLLNDPNDKTNLVLVFGNVTEQDILLKTQLDQLAEKHERFKIYYAVDKGKFGHQGFINKDLLSKALPKPSDNVKLFVCGPPLMVKAISGSKAPDYSQGELGGILNEMKYPKEKVFKF